VLTGRAVRLIRVRFGAHIGCSQWSPKRNADASASTCFFVRFAQGNDVLGAGRLLNR